MNQWLLLDVDLRFHEKSKPITNRYRGILQGSSGTLYGMLFTRSPATMKARDEVSVQTLVWAFPQHPCTDLQDGGRVVLMDTPSLTRAEGVITKRHEYLSQESTIEGVFNEVRARGT
ncbi:MAG TPA: hypothetical protein VF753_03895 [Terriglobales bacterium]